MNLESLYMGLRLKSPLIASASPLSDKLDNIKRMEDAGAGAVVLYSLFEEQIRREREALHYYLLHGTESYAEALTYFPEPVTYHASPDQYLELIRKARETVDIPIIASLNGTTLGGWTRFAQNMAQAGAHALELNVYYIPTDPYLSGNAVEQTYLDILAAVKSVVSVPVAMKLSPYFSNMAYMARRLDEVGANALVLFNRFYQPDINIETLEVTPNVVLSSSADLRLPLTWIGILYGRVQASLALTSGVHTGEDAVKAILAGASAVCMTSALLRNGIDHIRTVESGLRAWMTQHEYESVQQMRGAVSQMHAEDPSAFERVQYMRALSEYKPTV
ncbi:MAG: dihydroorotate dehydrogenase [Candidatus Thermofonsia Clade 1 bacterium]|uniref:Dihydroorotate dehydrogenase n=1 Tax=Candidatus Thermofonsia Clade 1 bacterium TaxID=2364210 RepID=A0A2M8NYH1_9CHLR|nr:MAG: dihydroorotate dehydrogenase [Candidatus Thermofonsia Clade 1 bacterium]